MVKPALSTALLLTDQSLHHKLVLKVEDLVAVQSLSLLDAQNGLSALQFVSVY